MAPLFSRNTKLLITALMFIAGTLFVQAELTRGTHKVLRSKITWGDSIEKGFAAAKKSRKPVMVDFFSSACDACQEYKDDVFDTEEFQDVASKFELVEVNLNVYPELGTKYKVDDLPDIRFYSPDGKLVNRVLGFESDIDKDMRKAL